MNDWFSEFTRLAKGSKARADAVNALFDLMVTGMDKMPTEIQMNSGTRNFAADTGAVNAYACALSHVSTAYEDGQHIVLFIAAADVNTSVDVTLNVSTIGNVGVFFPDGNKPAIGDLTGMCEFRYSATDSVWHFVTTSLARVAAAAASAAAALVSENNAAASEASAASSAAAAAASAATLLNTKVIDIGDWDMNTDASKAVSHGLAGSLSKIRTIKVLIRNDAGTNYYDFDSENQNGTTAKQAYADVSNMVLTRATSGIFDNGSFGSTSYNRGWITIQYTD